MLLVLTLLVPASPALAAQAEITSAGPLERIIISDLLNCQVKHADATVFSFYDSNVETGACGTFVATDGTLYGPQSLPAGGNASPRTSYTPVSQSAVTGTGQATDPYRVVTVVDLGTSGLRITEINSYVVGQESYRTDTTLTNTGASTAAAVVYRAGDCYLANDDRGYGRYDADTGAIACTTGLDPGSLIEQWYPLTPGSDYYQANYAEVWEWIGSQQPFPNTCRCTDFTDNGAGLSWTRAIPAGASSTVSHLTTFSPLGIVPVTTTKVADTATSVSGGDNGYTITFDNPNTTAVTLTSIIDALPDGFAYRAGTTTGATTADPTITGQTLTWTGSFTIPAQQSTSLSFGVTVAGAEGTYYNQASGSTNDVAVVGTGPTAPITVQVGDVPPPLSAVTTTKVADTATSVSGGDNGYTITFDNPNTTAVTLTSIIDTLPDGFAYRSGTTTGATTADPTIAGQTLTWTGSFTIPAEGSTSLSFGVTVAGAEGSYYNEAGGTSEDLSVTPTGPTAAVTVEAPDPPPPPGDSCVPLLAGQTTPAGDVCVIHADGQLRVTYTTGSGWELRETHLALADTLAGIPRTTRGGNAGQPIPGHFAHAGRHAPGTTTHTYMVSAAGLDLDAGIVVAAHAVLERPDGEGVMRESAWGDGTRFVPRGNWATHFGFGGAAE
jgi:uncharacterized repeat protein (TIGR01451 family)